MADFEAHQDETWAEFRMVFCRDAIFQRSNQSGTILADRT